MATHKRLVLDDESAGYNTEEEMIKNLGYGLSLYKDEADEANINRMKDFEKDQILADRHEKMIQYKEKVKILREIEKSKKEANANQGIPKDDQKDALRDLKAQRQKRLIRKHSDSEKSDSKRSGSDGSEKSGDSYSSGEDSMGDSDGSAQRKGINFIDLEKIRISRSDLERWCDEIFFEENVTGAFVKINIGNQDHTDNYMICEILGVKPAKQPYKLNTSEVNKDLVVRYGHEGKPFCMQVISNSKFTAQEFANWRKRMEKEKLRIPDLDYIEEIEAKIKKARNHTYSSSEINKIIERNINDAIQKGSTNMNIPYIQTQIETQYNVAKKQLDEELEKESQNLPSNVSEAQEIVAQLRNNLDKLEEIKRKKREMNQKKNTVGDYNSLAQRKQIEEDRKRSELIQKKQKSNTGFDAFSTISCAPQILWDTQNNKNQLSLIKQQSKEQSNKEKKREKKAKSKREDLMLKPQDRLKSEFEKAVIRRDKYLERVKKVDLKISHLISEDPHDFSKFPAFNKTPMLTEMNPILKAKLEEKHRKDLESGTKKVYTLDEYYQKFML